MTPELIIFDCDGVLIDSEGVASTIIAQELTALGWAMDADTSMRLFIGMSITDMEPVIEAKIARKLPRNGGRTSRKNWSPRCAHNPNSSQGRPICCAKSPPAASPGASPPTPRMRKWKSNSPAPACPI